MQQKKTILTFIPNTITSLNVFSGCISITFAFNGQLEIAAYFIFLAAVFDFFDGFTARLLDAYSQMGKELDSLADMVSFGVAPAAILYQIMLASILEYDLPPFIQTYLPLLAFLLAIFSALRLAKFNLDERQHLTFIGLATPPNAMFFAALIFISESETLAPIQFVFHNIWVLLVLILEKSKKNNTEKKRNKRQKKIPRDKQNKKK
jgi:CDP-diacylglycerol---serine O-phosphatidyltransferase